MAQNGRSGTAIDWQSAMAEAARQFARRLADPRDGGRHELRVTLLRLGFSLADADAAVANGPRLAAARLRGMRAALRRELDACKRRARAARIDYDLNRHIAVFRALRQLEGAPAEPASSPAGRSRAVIASRSSAVAARVASSIRR